VRDRDRDRGEGIERGVEGERDGGRERERARASEGDREQAGNSVCIILCLHTSTTPLHAKKIFIDNTTPLFINHL